MLAGTTDAAKAAANTPSILLDQQIGTRSAQL